MRNSMRTIEPPGRLPALALALALLLPFASLPVFALGYWDKAEPMVVWFHATAALTAFAVAVDLWRRGGRGASPIPARPPPP